ncbi:Peptide transport system permease protein sapB [Mannheimia haemolytica]|uniref:Peptide transport system permease protein sapB n=1 Tax=Mannheimia haemolytica TaxID=75985 RepID=A0A378MZ68_MANHA|nr:Peptide transport system permease protein sapB [Mannheimia haemolytica]
MVILVLVSVMENRSQRKFYRCSRYNYALFIGSHCFFNYWFASWFFCGYSAKNNGWAIIKYTRFIEFSRAGILAGISAMYYASLNQWEVSAIGEIHSLYPKQMVTGFLLLDIWLSDVPYKLKMMQSALHHLALPTLVLAVPATLEVMHITQARAGYVMKQNYIKIAKTRGWTPFRVWRTYIICNTLPALLPMIARTFILIFAFGMLIENIFSWGGIGRWLINALAIQDYNAISAE